MKSKTLIYVLFFVIILGSAIQASAFMYDLNQSISGGLPTYTVPSYGTLKITDDIIAGKADILISLNLGSLKTGNIDALGAFPAVLRANDLLLSASGFNTLDTLGLIFGAVHAGNLNANGDSSWLGAEPSNPNPPEPGTMLLLGTGLFCLAVYRKRTAA